MTVGGFGRRPFRFLQATFVSPKRSGYRQVRRNGSAPNLHSTASRPLWSAEFQRPDSHDSSIDSHHGWQEKRGHNHRKHDETVKAPVNFLPNEGHQAEQSERGETEGHHRYLDGHSFNAGGNNETSMSKIASKDPVNASCSSSSSPGAIFLWKGHNYLVKMAHDLEYLDDENVAAPVSSWLGFSIRGNPFLVPPDGHDICEALRQDHEKRREEAAVRRRQRQLQLQHRHGGGGGNEQRCLPRSRSRSRSYSRSQANSGSSHNNRRRLSSDRDNDVLAPSSSLQQGEQEQEAACTLVTAADVRGAVVSPLATTAVSQEHQQHQPAPLRADPKENERDRSLIATGLTMAGGEGDGGGTFITEKGVVTAEGSIGSMSTSIEPPLVGSLAEIEQDDIPCELSSGEEEEVQWSGGGHLVVPIIPDLPEAIRSKASAAAAILSNEGASRQWLESNARESLANAKRTQELLNKPGQEHSFRVESLAERSSREGLRGALVDRHIGATRLKPAASMVDLACCWEEGSLLRRVSTAPARGVSVRQRTPSRSDGGEHRTTSATRAREGQDHTPEATMGSSRGGVRVSVDGHREVAAADGYNKRNMLVPISPAALHPLVSTSRRGCGGGGGVGAPLLHLHHPQQPPEATEFEGGTRSISVMSPTERSTAGSSLQASSSSMSSRARARAVAVRPTARRPFWRNGGRLIITDPGQSPDIRHKAATLIQAAFLAVWARSFARRLRGDRERATLMIGRTWRRSRVRVAMWKAKCMRRAQELRRVAEGRSRNRAAHLLQTFFRDIKYRRKRVRGASCSVRPTANS